MPRSKKIDMEKVLACLNTACTKCGHIITPDRIVRPDFGYQKCSACDEVFVPSKRS